MEPLQSVPVPMHGVLVGINTQNSWPVPRDGRTLRLAYIATNSTQRLSFISLQSATHPQHVLLLASRPATLDDMPYGVVIELHLAQDLAEGESVHVSLAHAGASTYFPPQQIDDAR